MNKTEFVGHVAKKSELTNDEASRAVKAVIEVIEETLSSGQDVAFAGFGKFSVSDRAERVGVNPQDPTKKVTIPARRVPRFTPGAVLKQKVASGAAAKPAAKKKK